MQRLASSTPHYMTSQTIIFWQSNTTLLACVKHEGMITHCTSNVYTKVLNKDGEKLIVDSLTWHGRATMAQVFPNPANITITIGPNSWSQPMNGLLGGYVLITSEHALNNNLVDFTNTFSNSLKVGSSDLRMTGFM